MANIKVTVDYPISDGAKLKFRTPCESTSVEGLVVTYPVKDGVGYAVKSFTFVDAHGTELSGVGNVFTSDVMIEVLLDVTHGKAYIKNADTNSYIEDIKKTVERMDNERQAIFADAGRSIEECKDATKKAVDAAKGVITIEQNSQKELRFWVGTKEEYEAKRNTIPSNTFCLITDDLTKEELLEQIEALQKRPYIVEQGTSGIWTYEKWSNGISKCWGTFQYDMKRITFLKDINNISTFKPAYCGIDNEFCNIHGIGFPYELFVDRPFINYDAANGNGQNGLTFGQGMAKGAKGLGNNKTTGALYIDFPLGVHEDADAWKLDNETDQSKTYLFLNNGYVPCQISLEAKGRWK